MKKLRLFFMMTFALLFAGWAYAQGNEAGGNDVNVTPVNPNPYPITVTVGEGGEDLLTGIFNNAYAYWPTSMVPAGYWETEKMFTFEYEQLTDEGASVVPANIRVVNQAVIGVGAQTFNNFQFPVDQLVPNTLYKVRFFVSEPVAEGTTPEAAQLADYYKSKWVYFLSAPAQLQQGKLVWNWEPGKTVEGEEGLKYEYLEEADQVTKNGGVMKFDYDNYFHSYSIYTTLPDVTGTVEIYKDGAKVGTVTKTVTDPEAATNNVTNLLNGLQLTYNHEYALKAYASYAYVKKTLDASEDGTEFYQVITEGTGTMTSDPVLTRGPRVYGNSEINPMDIHTGVGVDKYGNPVTTVTLVNLPGAGEVNTVAGYLFYKTADMTKPVQLVANMWDGSGVAQWEVPVTDKEFTFGIEIVIQDEEINPETGSNMSLMKTTQDGTVHMGNPLTVNLWDKYLIWGDGRQSASYTLPLPKGLDYTGVTFNLKYWRRHWNTGYSDGGATESYDYDLNDPNSTGNSPSSQRIITDEKTGEKFIQFYGFRYTIQEYSWFVKMEVSASLPTSDDQPEGDHTFWNKLKQTWNFYTAEGCVVTEFEATHKYCTYTCSSDLFRGEVTARQWDDPTKPLMWPEDDEPEREAARLHFYDWAWSPAAATFKKIGVEYDREDGDDHVEFKSTTYEERKTKETLEKFDSKVSYIVPTKYNNAQAIGKVTVDEGTYQTVTGENNTTTTEFVSFKNREVTPSAEAQEFTDGGWGAKFAATTKDTEGNVDLKKAYGIHTFVLELKGEVPEGRTATTEQRFTIACRQGLVNLGSEGTAWDAEEYGVIDVFNFQLTDHLHRPTVVPQYIINSIFNNNYLSNRAQQVGWSGYCVYDIYATLAELIGGKDGEVTDASQKWSEKTAHGSINDLGEVKLDNFMIFTEVPDNKWYQLDGYMLYTPVRYMNVGADDVPVGTEAWADYNPEVGPVVKVPFSVRFQVPEMVDINQEITPEVKYYIVDKDEKGQGYVEARIYDKREGTLSKFNVELLTNAEYTGIDKVTGVWHDGSTAEVDGEVVTTKCYMSFIFPVDNDATTDKIFRYWEYGYKAYYINDAGENGPVKVVALNAAAAISTPDPYLTFKKHAPQWFIDANGGPDAWVESETVGPWPDELTPLCVQLQNFFAFTNSEIPEFENSDDYYTYEGTYTDAEGNTVEAVTKNLVFNYNPKVSVHPLDFIEALEQYAEEAISQHDESRRASVADEITDDTYYSLKVRLNDAKHLSPYVDADGKTRNYRNEYFNDVEFFCFDAQYDATFTKATRTVMIPFSAATEATVHRFSGMRIEENGTDVSFLFSEKKLNGQPNNTLAAQMPYIVKAAAGNVNFHGEKVTVLTNEFKPIEGTDLYEGEAEAKLQASDIYLHSFMKGTYVAKWNQEIVPEPGQDGYELDYYRYDGAAFPALMKKGEVKDAETGTYWDASYKDGQSREWKPCFNGVSPFEAYFTFEDHNFADGSIYSISIRFEDEDSDATMIEEDVIVEVESSEIFDLQGRKVLEPVKGQIYIQNGKKILF